MFEGSRGRSQASIKGRMFKGYIGLRGDSILYFVRGEDCWEGVPNHEFINKEYISIGMRSFGEVQRKVLKSEQYHFSGESPDS